MARRKGGKVVNRPCKHCGEVLPMVGKQRVCKKCQRAQKTAWQNEYKHIPAAERKVRADKRRKDLGLTFSFSGGKWTWHAPNGLSNGPFDTIRAARNDARKAFGLGKEEE